MTCSDKIRHNDFEIAQDSLSTTAVTPSTSINMFSIFESILNLLVNIVYCAISKGIITHAKAINTLLMLNCLSIYFIHLKVELLTQYPTPNDENYSCMIVISQIQLFY